ncbi:hypothetical protein MNBD_NITROSPINAE04-1824 [hydrothermal vent metagenome]|uniref:Uncharacterized protein n=1 Tax=hydrothermal vent metagenome TaxID=652676 RepID=A0A3B1C3K3_9ZZZZ
MEERRKYAKIALKIYAKGFINSGGKFLKIAGRTEILSKDGASIELTKDSSAMIIEAESLDDSLVDSEVMLTLISYIEDNIAATGNVAHIKKTDSAMAIVDVKFNPLDRKSLSILDHILKMSPDLRNASAAGKKEIVTRFESFREFLTELTQFAILTDKEAMFWIANERFVFVGIHMDDNELVHGDCIESVDNPGKVFCPDCDRYIDAAGLL